MDPLRCRIEHHDSHVKRLILGRTGVLGRLTLRMCPSSAKQSAADCYDDDPGPEQQAQCRQGTQDIGDDRRRLDRDRRSCSIAIIIHLPVRLFIDHVQTTDAVIVEPPRSIEC